MEVLLTDPNGMSLNFHLSGSSAATLTSPPYALSNTAGDMPSGKYDPRNIRISYDGSRKITVYASDGTVRFYYQAGGPLGISHLYLLEKEILPNGKVLKYHYNSLGYPDLVESLDPQERFVYASIRIQGSAWQESCQFISSSAGTAHYTYERKRTPVKIKHKGSYTRIFPSLLTSVSSPFYRHETLSYPEKFLLRS